jgi:hypothetical protein
MSFIASVGFGIACLCLLGGCGDETRTTGTQVKMSDEAKAQIKDMRDMYKQDKVRKDEGKTSGSRRSRD